MHAQRLPYAFHTTDWATNDIQNTNAFYHLVSHDFSLLESEDDFKLNSNTPGGIGLEFHYEAGNFDAQEEPPSIENASEYFNTGRPKHKMRFKVLIAHPTFKEDRKPTPHLRHIISLTIDDCLSVRLVGERDPLQKFEDGIPRPRRYKPYTLQFGTAVFDSESKCNLFTYDDVCIVENLIDLKTTPCQEQLTKEQCNQFVTSLEERLKELLPNVINSCFVLDSIRPHQLSTQIEHVGFSFDGQDVGYHGESAWQIAISNENARMGNFHNHRFTANDAEILWSVFTSSDIRENDPKINWIYSQFPIEQQELFARSDRSNLPLDNETIANWFNQLLSNRNVWKQSLWELIHDQSDTELEDFRYIPNGAIEKLIDRGIDKFSDEDWRELIYYAITDAVWDLDDDLLPSSEVCYFREYLAWWLKRLFDIDYISAEPDSNRIPSDTIKAQKRRRPNQFLNRPAPFRSFWPFNKTRERSLSRLHSPCFGTERRETRQPPKQFSSAVHQVFPMITQLGMMKSGDVFGIENPEVHLHPSLQVQVTDMLLDHAKSGRRIILETHSDLVLRRAIRAILDEKIKQACVTIYCVNLGDRRIATVDGKNSSFIGSTIEPIEVDENGRITNWPEGFLDEDIRESQRLLDVMYGHFGEDSDAD
jgi:hypothetical protein